MRFKQRYILEKLRYVKQSRFRRRYIRYKSQMPPDREQTLLDRIASLHAKVAELSALNEQLQQAVDALSRRIYGKSSEKLATAQLEFVLGQLARPATPPLRRRSPRRKDSSRRPAPLALKCSAASAFRKTSPSLSKPSIRPRSPHR